MAAKMLNVLLAAFVLVASAIGTAGFLLKRADCTVELLHPENWRLGMADYSCREVRAASREYADDRRYTQLDGRTYWFSEDANVIYMIAIDGPVMLDRIRASLDGSYVSDGSTVLYERHKVQTMTPPIEPAKLRRFQTPAGGRSQYVTDGRWVLYEHQVYSAHTEIEGASLNDQNRYRSVACIRYGSCRLSRYRPTAILFRGRTPLVIFVSNISVIAAEPLMFLLV